MLVLGVASDSRSANRSLLKGVMKKQKPQSPLHAAAAELGAAGGRVGGPARAKSLTAEQRSAIARKAAKVRWAKTRATKKKKKKEAGE